jgi:hypothetical protein
LKVGSVTFALALVGVVLATTAVAFYVALWHRMPTLEGYVMTQKSSYTNLPCGDASEELWVGNSRTVVVWTLSDAFGEHRLAIVFVTDDGYVAYVDADFDGKWEQRVVGPPGSGNSLDFYAKVKGCESLASWR